MESTGTTPPQLPAQSLLPTQPSSYKTLLKTSLKVYSASFLRIIPLSLLLSVITFIPRLLSIAIGQEIFLNLPPHHPQRLWLLPINLVCVILFIGILWRMHCVIKGFHEPLIEDLTVGIKKVIFVLIAAFIQCVIIFAVMLSFYGLLVLLNKHSILFFQQLIGMIFTVIVFTLQILLILYLYMLFIFLTPLIAIENKGVFGSLERSAYLVLNNLWRVFSLQLTPWLCYFVLLLIIRFMFKIDIHIYFIEQSAHSLPATLLHIILFALFTPWMAAILLTQLNDLEQRKILLLLKHRYKTNKL